MKVELSAILQGEPLLTSYIIGQLTGSVLNTDKKWSKQSLYTFLLDSTLLDISHTVPDFLTPQRDISGFQYQCNNAKNEDF